MKYIKELYSSILIVLVVVSLFLILSQLLYQQWFFDTFAHFYTLYSIVFIVGMIALVIIKQYKSLIIFAPFFMYLMISIGHLYFGGDKDVNISNTVKISAINVLSANQSYQKVSDFIKKEQPDILVLQEVTPIWTQQLNNDLQIFPYRLEHPQNDNFGIAFYSKIPIENLETKYFNDRKIPSIVATFEWQNEPITFVATHPVPPINTLYFDLRNEQFQRLSTYLNQINTEKIVIGDLNTTSFSRHFKQLKNSTNLTDSRKGFGRQATWGSFKPFVNLALDHCLISQKIKVKSRKVGEDIGSDHLPIVLEVGF